MVENTEIQLSGIERQPTPPLNVAGTVEFGEVGERPEMGLNFPSTLSRELIPSGKAAVVALSFGKNPEIRAINLADLVPGLAGLGNLPPVMMQLPKEGILRMSESDVVERLNKALRETARPEVNLPDALRKRIKGAVFSAEVGRDGNVNFSFPLHNLRVTERLDKILYDPNSVRIGVDLANPGDPDSGRIAVDGKVYIKERPPLEISPFETVPLTPPAQVESRAAEVDPIGEQMGNAVDKLINVEFPDSLLGIKDSLVRVAAATIPTAKNGRPVQAAGLMVGGAAITLFAACGGGGAPEARPAPVEPVQPATPTEEEPRIPTIQIDVESAKADGQITSEKPETPEVLEIQPTVTVEELPSVTKKYRGERFELSQAGLDITLPGLVDTLQIPEGDRFTVAINLGKLRREVAAIGNTRRDITVGGQVKLANLIPGYTESELYGIGVPKKGVLTDRMQDIVKRMNSMLQMRGEPIPELDPSIEKFIKDANLTLERGRDGSLILSVDLLNRTIRDKEGNVIYSPDHFRLAFEGVEGLDPAQIKGSVYQDGKRVALIENPTKDEQHAAAPTAEPIEKPPTVEPAEKSSPEQKATLSVTAQPVEPEPTKSRQEYPTPTQEELQRAYEEATQPQVSIGTSVDALSISMRGGRLALNDFGYEQVKIKFNKSWLEEDGDSTVILDLTKLPEGTVLNFLPGGEEYGAFNIEVPDDPEVRKQWNADFAVSEMLEAVGDLPLEEIEMKRRELGEIAGSRGVDAAVREFAQYLSTEFNAADPEQLVQQIEEYTRRKTISEFRSRVLTTVPGEYRSLVRGVLTEADSLVEEQGVDAAAGIIRTRINTELVNRGVPGAYRSQIMNSVDAQFAQSKEDIFKENTPHFPKFELPDKLPPYIMADSTLTIRKGQLILQLPPGYQNVEFLVGAKDGSFDVGALEFSGKLQGEDEHEFDITIPVMGDEG